MNGPHSLLSEQARIDDCLHCMYSVMERRGEEEEEEEEEDVEVKA